VREDGAQRRIVEYRVADKRQSPSAERDADQRRVDLEHTIYKPAGRPGMTVMRFVRVNDDDPPGRTRLRFATIMETLDPASVMPTA